MSKAIKILLAVVALLAVGGGSFYAGLKYEENRLMNNPTALIQTMARGVQGGRFQRGDLPQGDQVPPDGAATQFGVGRANMGGTVGTVESVDGNTVILKTDSGTLTVLTTDTTLIEKTVSVDASGLEAGEQVIVSGTDNGDGTLTARSIRSVDVAGGFLPNQP